MENLLTIVITTSPVPIHPSTEIIECTMKSLQLLTDVKHCSKIIVCDGIKLQPQQSNVETTPKYCTLKRGIVSQSLLKKYTIYKQNLKMLLETNPIYNTFQLLELSTHHGFAYAVHSCLPIITTPFVFIIQHDYIFTKFVPIGNLVHTMSNNNVDNLNTSLPKINYIGFVSKTTLNYLKTSQNEYREKCRKPIDSNHTVYNYPLSDDNFSKNSDNSLNFVPLCPLFFWYDKNHLTSCDYLKNVIFNKEINQVMNKGDFIEDTWGQLQKNLIMKKGFQQWYSYGSFLYYPKNGQEISLRHLHGRHFGNHRIRGINRIVKNQEKESTENATVTVDHLEGLSTLFI